MTSAAANRRGILWMVIAMTAFMGNDAMIKALGERLPAAQMIVVRGIMAISIITLVAWRMGALPRIRDTLSGWVVARGACEGLGVAQCLWAQTVQALARAVLLGHLADA